MSTILPKSYKSAFVLDPAKLLRIVEVITSHFQRLEKEVELQYSVQYRDKTKTTYRNVNDVLSLDNKRSNPIETLRVSAYEIAYHPPTFIWSNSESEGTVLESPERQPYRTGNEPCRITFDSHDGLIATPVEFILEIPDDLVRNSFYSVLDEQIERTLVKGDPIASLRRRVPLPGFMSYFTIILILMVIWILGQFSSSSRNLTTLQMAGFVEGAKGVSTFEEKIDFLFALRRAELEAAAGVNSQRPQITVKGAVRGAVAIVLIWLAVYIYSTMYPTGVFDWGDEGTRYRTLISRRSGLWWGVVFGVFVEVVAGYIAF